MRILLGASAAPADQAAKVPNAAIAAAETVRRSCLCMIPLLWRWPSVPARVVTYPILRPKAALRSARHLKAVIAPSRLRPTLADLPPDAFAVHRRLRTDK